MEILYSYLKTYSFENIKSLKIHKEEIVLVVTNKIDRFNIDKNYGSYFWIKDYYIAIPKRLEGELIKNSGKIPTMRLRINIKNRRIRLTAFIKKN